MAACAAVLGMTGVWAQTVASEPKVFRYAFRIAETGFDPGQVTDLYSRTITAGIFESPLRFAHLARPYKLEPAGCEMPEIAPDFKTLTFKVRPGTFFAPDPAFKSVKRELVAADYVYSLKRHYDPKVKSGNLYVLENAGILGMDAVRQAALEGKPFDYDREVEGLKVLDKYRWQLRLKVGDPRFVQSLADPFVGAMAREVVEFYGDKIMEHPVGTGPYMLKNDEWRRSSKIVLVKNPNYRDEFYNEQAPADRPDLQALAAKLKGRKLPMIDRVEFSIIEENQPRWLAFMNGEADMVEEVPNEYVGIAMPNNQLAPNLAQRGIYMNRYLRADLSHSFFNMEHPVVGGYEPHKVALRRAISLGVDLDKEIRLVRKGQAIPAQGIIGPNTYGYSSTFKSEMSEFNPAKAKALLDVHGYTDKDGDGWRDQPDGKPLVLEYATQPDLQNRQLAEQWQKNMDALGIRIRFKVAKWPENLKASRAGKLMMWGVGWSVNVPDADAFLTIAYGPNKGQSNHPRFDLPAYNRLYEQQRELPDGPERQAVLERLNKLTVAYMPYKAHVHRTYTDMAQPWVIGLERNIFRRDFWQYLDIDTAALKAAQE
ncbi:ABC-type transport system substrate-binding protein [Inhella inkyongensis]|uniref:ABC-type transport system substrate-binding protein n=2 Tax=Inhella inkyongensis TaxID=392593 RepID=A0A840S286_9BURK|nr:ABC transporter substrate-binding protein [Inhella inkyongensis]MBB5202710.1 ABC-type transport system substrate-binding protein [Inhella inkyongensis]